MKKIIVLILSLVYMTTSNGMVFSDHFCMGKKATNKCLCSKSEKKSDCCKDEYKVVKLDNAHKATVTTFEVNVPVVALPTTLSNIDLSYSSGIQKLILQANGPPIFASPNIYLLNCVFRI